MKKINAMWIIPTLLSIVWAYLALFGPHNKIHLICDIIASILCCLIAIAEFFKVRWGYYNSMLKPKAGARETSGG